MLETHVTILEIKSNTDLITINMMGNSTIPTMEQRILLATGGWINSGMELQSSTYTTD